MALYFLVTLIVVQLWHSRYYVGDPWAISGPMGLASLMALLMLPTMIVIDAIVFVLRWDLFGIPRPPIRRRPPHETL